MDSIIELLRELINPDWIMAHGGLFLVAFIIFAETGLFVGFLLPGDSLLFITGMIIAGAKTNPFPFDSHPLNLVFWIILLTIAAIIGNIVGYWFGKKSGPLLFLADKDDKQVIVDFQTFKEISPNLKFSIC